MKTFNNIYLHLSLIIFSIFFSTYSYTKEIEARENNNATECDPVVTVSANNKKRSRILSELGKEHGFWVNIPETDDNNISLEKTQKLSKVVESITKDTSVVTKFQKQGDCQRMISVSMVGDKAPKGFDSTEKTEYEKPIKNKANFEKGKKNKKDKKPKFILKAKSKNPNQEKKINREGKAAAKQDKDEKRQSLKQLKKNPKDPQKSQKNREEAKEAWRKEHKEKMVLKRKEKALATSTQTNNKDTVTKNTENSNKLESDKNN